MELKAADGAVLAWPRPPTASISADFPRDRHLLHLGSRWRNSRPYFTYKFIKSNAAALTASRASVPPCLVQREGCICISRSSPIDFFLFTMHPAMAGDFLTRAAHLPLARWIEDALFVQFCYMSATKCFRPSSPSQAKYRSPQCLWRSIVFRFPASSRLRPSHHWRRSVAGTQAQCPSSRRLADFGNPCTPVCRAMGTFPISKGPLSRAARFLLSYTHGQRSHG